MEEFHEDRKGGKKVSELVTFITEAKLESNIGNVRLVGDTETEVGNHRRVFVWKLRVYFFLFKDQGFLDFFKSEVFVDLFHVYFKTDFHLVFLSLS